MGFGRAVRLDSLPLAQGGRLTGIYSAILDITVQKRAEALLHDERKRLALIVEQAAEMILMTDRDGVVQYVNNAFLQSSGKKRAEVIGSADPGVCRRLRTRTSMKDSGRGSRGRGSGTAA